MPESEVDRVGVGTRNNLLLGRSVKDSLLLGRSVRDCMLLRVSLSGLLALQAFAGFFPGHCLWGVNHLAYWPILPRLLWTLLGLLVVWTPLGVWIGRFLIQRAAPLLERRPIAYGVLPATGALLFWMLRCRTHFLGDGWLLAEMVQDGRPFHGYDFIDYFLHARLFALLGIQGENGSFQLFGVMSVLAGAVYLAAAAWSARHLSPDRGGRVLLYALLVFFPPVQIFMGYVETYSFLMIFMLLFLTLLILHYRHGFSLALPAAAFGLGLCFHLDALFLAPLLAVALFLQAERAWVPFRKRLIAVAGPALGGLILAAIIYLAAGYDRAWFEADFVAGKPLQEILTPWSGPHSLWSWVHWKDILNLLSLLAPVPIALLATALPSMGRLGRWPRETLLMLAGGVWLVVLMSLLFMKLGAVRDWDLYAAHAPIFPLGAFLAWSHITSKRPQARGASGTAAIPRDKPTRRTHWRPRDARVVGLVVMAAFFLAAPWFWLNAGEERSLQRFRDVIGDLSRFQRAYAHEGIAKYYRARGMIAEATEEYRITSETFPENARFCALLGALQYNAGDSEAAFQTFQRALTADSTFAQALEMAARIHVERGRFADALPYARRLAGRPEESPRAAALHGRAAEELGLLEEAQGAYKRALDRDADSTDRAQHTAWLERAAGLALFTGEFERSEQLFRRALGRKPASVSARTGLALAIWQPLSQDSVSWGDPSVRQRLIEAELLLGDLIREGQADEQIGTWHGEIRAALAR